MAQLIVVLSVILLLPMRAAAQSASGGPPVEARTPAGESSRLRDFVDASFTSPFFYVQVVGAGIIDQASDFPKEWGGGEGFRDRTLVRLGQGFLSEGIGHSVAAVLKHRVRYDACDCTGALPRIGHAFVRAFVSVTDDGGRAPNISLWTAKYASAAIADPWYPTSYKKDDILIQGSVGIVIAGGLNVVKEFAPELVRMLPGR